jgi:ParB/RepB/Spo0J family partition protein
LLQFNASKRKDFTMKISLATIVQPAWNSRLAKAGNQLVVETAKIKSLAASLIAEGQLTPVEVETTDKDGEFLLIFGTRRVAAAKVAGWTEIDATVRPPSQDSERIVRNIVENVKRENLTSYEEARACARLRELGLKNPDIATKVGFSSQKVSNLAVTLERLPAPILAEWQKQNPVASDRFLRELAVEAKYPTTDSILQAWDAKVRETAPTTDSDGEEGADATDVREPGKRGKGKGSSAGVSVNGKVLNHVIDALSSVIGSPDLAPQTRTWGKHLLDYLMLAKDKPPQGIPPIPVVVKPVPLTDEQKAAVKAQKTLDNLTAKLAAAQAAMPKPAAKPAKK